MLSVVGIIILSLLAILFFGILGWILKLLRGAFGFLIDGINGGCGFFGSIILLSIALLICVVVAKACS